MIFCDCGSQTTLVLQCTLGRMEEKLAKYRKEKLKANKEKGSEPLSLFRRIIATKSQSSKVGVDFVIILSDNSGFDTFYKARRIVSGVSGVVCPSRFFCFISLSSVFNLGLYSCTKQKLLN